MTEYVVSKLRSRVQASTFKEGVGGNTLLLGAHAHMGLIYAQRRRLLGPLMFPAGNPVALCLSSDRQASSIAIVNSKYL